MSFHLIISYTSNSIISYLSLLISSPVYTPAVQIGPFYEEGDEYSNPDPTRATSGNKSSQLKHNVEICNCSISSNRHSALLVGGTNIEKKNALREAESFLEGNLRINNCCFFDSHNGIFCENGTVIF